jgi:hypothetical protein
MSSNSQKKANAKNSLNSTGPKTLEGKIVSSKNSLTHGVLSKDIIIKNESISEFEDIRESLYKDLNINGTLEEILAEKILNSLWRLRRIITAESEMFKFNQWGDNTIISKFTGFDSKCMHSLSRYESSLEKKFYKALHEIQRIQAEKKGKQILTPIAIDINTTTE